MIFWIASYPKSGNTWLRALISTYFFSKDGKFDQGLLKNIDQFPTSQYFETFNHDKTIPGDTCKYWISAQEKINLKKQVRFYKTHNVFGKVNNYDFTNSQNSIGCIYVVRDPRNVITSLKNHYQLDDNQALDWITSEKKFIYNVQNFEEDGYSDFQFISSWSTNYKSWKIQKKIPIKIIKYENLLNETFYVFKDIIKFINKITNNNSKINIEKLKNSINSTSFNKLKTNEERNGFSEAITSKKSDKKIPFFYLGPKNDWRKMLDHDLKNKLNDIYKENLLELSYN